MALTIAFRKYNGNYFTFKLRKKKVEAFIISTKMEPW